MNKERVLKLLRKHVYSHHATIEGFALSRDVSASYISQQLSGKHTISKKLLDEIGIERSTIDNYVAIKKGDES